MAAVAEEGAAEAAGGMQLLAVNRVVVLLQFSYLPQMLESKDALCGLAWVGMGEGGGWEVQVASTATEAWGGHMVVVLLRMTAETVRRVGAAAMEDEGVTVAVVQEDRSSELFAPVDQRRRSMQSRTFSAHQELAVTRPATWGQPVSGSIFGHKFVS
jgi:hypothetical protein